jgi:hypothetical protein
LLSNACNLYRYAAGGWMARVYLQDFGVDDVASFVSLGSPLNAVPKVGLYKLNAVDPQLE